MKKYLSLLLILSSYLSLAQTAIYSENCGNPAATTSVNTYTGWQRYGSQVYTGNADVRTTLPSTTYTGASGLGNIFVTSTLNTNVVISNINTTGYTNLTLSFGHLKTTSASNGSQLAVEVSTDGSTWTTLSYSVPTGTSTSNIWRLVTPIGTIPSTSNLRIRFRMIAVVTGLQFRIDDIKLVGCAIPSAPTYTINTPSCQSATLTYGSNTYLQTLETDTNRTLNSPQAFTTSGTRYLRTVSSVTGCTSVWSNATSVPVNVIPLPTITQNPNNVETSNSLNATFIAKSSNAFYWQTSVDSINWTIVDSIQRDTLMLLEVNTTMNGRFYRIAANNTPCSDTVYSTPAKLTVHLWPLPVKMIYFEANQINDMVSLKWATAVELNNDKFIVERSENCNSWTELGQVRGVGNNNSNSFYSFEDYNPNRGVNYYRLKQVDYNGVHEYFNIVSLFVKNSFASKKYYNIHGIEVDKLELNKVYIEFDRNSSRKIMMID